LLLLLLLLLLPRMVRLFFDSSAASSAVVWTTGCTVAAAVAVAGATNGALAGDPAEDPAPVPSTGDRDGEPRESGSDNDPWESAPVGWMGAKRAEVCKQLQWDGADSLRAEGGDGGVMSGGTG
jgi:hypothetical protein